MDEGDGSAPRQRVAARERPVWSSASEEVAESLRSDQRDRTS